MFYVFEKLPTNITEFVDTYESFMFFDDAFAMISTSDYHNFVVDNELTIVAYSDEFQAEVELVDGKINL